MLKAQPLQKQLSVMEARLSKAGERRAKATTAVHNFEEMMTETWKSWNTHKSELTEELANLVQLRQALAGKYRSEQDEENEAANHLRRQTNELGLEKQELKQSKMEFEKRMRVRYGAGGGETKDEAEHDGDGRKESLAIIPTD